MKFLVTLFMVLAVLVLFFGPMLGCVPSTTPVQVSRAEVRSALNLVAEGVRTVDLICAQTARVKQDIPLAKTCKDAYDVARDSLIGIGEGVDAWNEGKHGETACALKKANAALASFRKVAFQAGAALPPLVDDAISFSSTVVGECHEPDAS